jgi:hypothetical protein
MAGPAFSTGTINVSQNADWLVHFLLTSDGNPIDLTGSTINMQIRKREGENSVMVDLSSPENGIAVTEPLLGEFTITIKRDITRRIPPDEYVTDITRLRPDGLVERLFEGVANINLGTTR